MIEPGVVVSDRYRILRTVGEGGMGTVFEAEHTGVGRRVAVKVLNPDATGGHVILERFQREARAAAAIGHDNIVDVFDFGVHESSPFMVMEYLKGESLNDRLARVGRLSNGHAAYVLHQVLSALEAAHEAGIVHRDLKPDNVFLVQKSGLPDFVKLLDFGIAKLKGDDAVSKSMTKTGAILGTPHYMAPEQALAKRDLDARVDVYAAGVMLYEMLTGVVPFDAPSEAELLMEIAYRMHPIPVPSTINAQIPPELDAIVVKAMAADRDQRFASASEFAHALQPWIEKPGADAIGDDPSRLKIVLKPGARVSLLPGSEQGVARSSVDAITGESMVPPEPVPAIAVGEMRPGSRRGVGFFAAIGVLVVVAVPTLWLVTHRRADARAVEPSSPVTASRDHAVVPPTTPIVDPDVHIDLENVPGDAVVTIDDAPTLERHLVLPRGSSHVVRVRAPGREEFVSSFHADRDRSIVIALVPTREPAAVVTPPASSAGNNIAGAAIHPSHIASRTSSTTVADAGAHESHPASAGRSHSITSPLPVSNEF